MIIEVKSGKSYSFEAAKIDKFSKESKQTISVLVKLLIVLVVLYRLSSNEP